jgi:hypothetical protein
VYTKNEYLSSYVIKGKKVKKNKKKKNVSQGKIKNKK